MHHDSRHIFGLRHEIVFGTNLYESQVYMKGSRKYTGVCVRVSVCACVCVCVCVCHQQTYPQTLEGPQQSDGVCEYVGVRTLACMVARVCAFIC